MSKKEGWQAYVHVNGEIQIKKYIEDLLEVDCNSPFIKKYLGVLLDKPDHHFSREEAEEYFLNIFLKK